jgi:hypothetical protein
MPIFKPFFGDFCLFSAKFFLNLDYWGRCYDHNFGEVCQFAAKKLAFYSKTNVIFFFKKLEVVSAKTLFFGRKYF